VAANLHPPGGSRGVERNGVTWGLMGEAKEGFGNDYRPRRLAGWSGAAGDRVGKGTKVGGRVDSACGGVGPLPPTA